MKNAIVRTFAWIVPILFAVICLVALAAIFSMPASAQEPAAASVVSLTAAASDPVSGIIVSLAVKYPWLTAVFAAIGILRTIFKPVMDFLWSRAKSTADTADDARLEQVERSWWFKALAWLLNYTASIKLPGTPASIAK